AVGRVLAAHGSAVISLSPQRAFPPACSFISSRTKSLKPCLRIHQAALRPAMPPPTITNEYFSVLLAAGNVKRSRSRWPASADSLTKEPSILRSAFADSPRSAALPVLRNVRRPTFKALPLMTDVAPVVFVHPD